MDAIEYLKELKRMCDSYPSCLICPLFNWSNEYRVKCHVFQKNHPEKAVELVEKWSKEHPAKTIKDDFLEKHPNAKMRDDGTPVSCAKYLGYKVGIDGKCPVIIGCGECWNTPLE